MTELTNDQREALGRLADLILDACAEAWGMIAPRGRMKSKQAIITALEYFTEPVWRELSQQREDNAELRRYFDLRRDADQRAIARWQKAHPGKELVWPDHADLCVWLMVRYEELKNAAARMVDAMEVCHVCGGLLALDDIESPHCEDCSGDCGDHAPPNCTPIFVLHRQLMKMVRDGTAQGLDQQTDCAAGERGRGVAGLDEKGGPDGK